MSAGRDSAVATVHVCFAPKAIAEPSHSNPPLSADIVAKVFFALMTKNSPGYQRSRISRERLLKRSQVRCVMARTIHRGGVMTRTLSRIAALVAIFVAQATFACAAEIKVYATIGVKHSLEDLTAKFEKTSGHRVSITWGTGAGLAKRIQAGEQADLLVLTRQGLDTLSKDGKVAVGTERNFTSSTQAVGIRKGAPRPDISTPEAFKATILNAKSVAYPDPAGGGLSGVLLTQLAERMGFAEQLKSKAKFPADNFAGKLVASGEAELAIQQKPELMSIEGVEILGPLPPEINVTTVFSAGVSKDAKESGPSTELLKYLESPEAAAVFKRDGFDPPPPASG